MALGGRRDPAAFAELVRARSGALYRTAYLLLGDRGLAQDLVQETLTKTYVAWPRLRDVTKAEAYARRTLVNTTISWRRRRSFHERPHHALPDRPSIDRTGDVDERDALWARLLELPPRQRAAIVLRYYEDLSEAATAEVMGCAVGTVKSQVSQGLARLRDAIGADANIDGSKGLAR